MKIAIAVKPNLADERLFSALVGELKRDPDFDVYMSKGGDIPADTDRILTFGGDGTVLEAVRAATNAGIDAPILGVNMGNLGFLTEFERDVDYAALKDALLSTAVKKRPLLDVSIKDSARGYALNDAVIKAEGSRPISLDLKIDGNFVDSYIGDGLIISTAVGSTAYALSAGGPVLLPDLYNFLVTPICAHSLHARPLVVGAGSVIEVQNVGHDAARVSLDGNAFSNLVCKNLSVKVEKAKKTASFVDVGQSDFYGKLLKKMNAWGRTGR